MQNILVVNVNWLGDVIFSTPVFKALRKAFPNSRISCLAVPRVRKILECCPFVDEIIEYDERGLHRGFLGKLQLIFHLRRQHFAIGFLLHRSWTRAFLLFAAGVPRRIGYDTKGRSWMLTHAIPENDHRGHRSDYYCHLLEAYGIIVDNRTCELSVLPDAKDRVASLLQEAGIQDGDYVIVINTGGNWDLKRWPEDHFVHLIKQIYRKSYTRPVRIVIPGAEKDIDHVQRIVDHFEQHRPIVLAGKTDITDLIGLMAFADLVISADSGPLHIANCVGKRTIGLYGPTRPEITGPRGTGENFIFQNDVGCNRAACYYLDCPDNVCMKSIQAESVGKMIWELILQK